MISAPETIDVDPLLSSLEIASRMKVVWRFRGAGATASGSAIVVGSPRDNLVIVQAMLSEGVIRTQGDRFWLDEGELTRRHAPIILLRSWLRRAAWKAAAVALLIYVLL